jgi:Holliday junction resolvase
MGVNGKQKGNAYERQVVNAFKVLFEDEGFLRNWSSGSIFGGQNRSRIKGVDTDFSEKVVGDIIVPEKFPFTIECKSYKDLDFHNIINGSCKKLDEWIEQAEGDAEVGDTYMLLVVKINNKGQYICTKDLRIENANINISEMSNVTRYKEKYYFYSLETFNDIANNLKPIIEWNEYKYKKGE